MMTFDSGWVRNTSSVVVDAPATGVELAEQGLGLLAHSPFDLSSASAARPVQNAVDRDGLPVGEPVNQVSELGEAGGGLDP
ncbi:MULTISPECIES: hypothetical protein [Streptomyces]|uniref:hypothetical protein n=1 Tax=Streptomyces TaxID=1883 RepID=UPI00136AC808|nr:hypothetical protein [Streptomyces sp. SID6137]